jgi:hypothetical protein
MIAIPFTVAARGHRRAVVSRGRADEADLDRLAAPARRQVVAGFGGAVTSTTHGHGLRRVSALACTGLIFGCCAFGAVLARGASVAVLCGLVAFIAGAAFIGLAVKTGHTQSGVERRAAIGMGLGAGIGVLGALGAAVARFGVHSGHLAHAMFVGGGSVGLGTLIGALITYLKGRGHGTVEPSSTVAGDGHRRRP